MIDLNPYNKKLVPFVIESIGAKRDIDDSFTIDVNSKGLVNTFSLPRDEKKLRNIIAQFGRQRTTLEDLRYSDLMFDERYCNGIYLFFEGDECCYVGSNVSRSIVERVGGHLALRQRDYMNSMVKYLAMHYHPHYTLIKDVASVDMCDNKVLNSLSDITFLFIPVRNDDGNNGYGIRILEDFMIHLFSPTLQCGTNGKNGKVTQVKNKYKW